MAPRPGLRRPAGDLGLSTLLWREMSLQLPGTAVAVRWARKPLTQRTRARSASLETALLLCPLPRCATDAAQAPPSHSALQGTQGRATRFAGRSGTRRLVSDQAQPLRGSPGRFCLFASACYPARSSALASLSRPLKPKHAALLTPPHGTRALRSGQQNRNGGQMLFSLLAGATQMAA